MLQSSQVFTVAVEISLLFCLSISIQNSASCNFELLFTLNGLYNLFTFLYWLDCMDQGLYLQNHAYPHQKLTSFFDCYNCFSKSESTECYITPQLVYLKKQQLKIIYPSNITQKAHRSEAYPSNHHSVLNNRTSIKNDNKRDTISLRRGRKVNSQYQNHIHSREAPQFKQYFINTGYPYMPHNLLIRTNNSNLPSSRLEVPQTISSEVPSMIRKRGTTKPPITFSYKISLPKTSNKSSFEVSMIPSQLKQNSPQISPFKQTYSVMSNSEASFGRELLSAQKFPQFYSSKERVEIFQIQAKKVSSGSKESNRFKKSSNVGNGKLQFHIRQTISIKQPEEEDLHESIVLPDKNFTHHNDPLNNLFLPIRQSEPQLQSLIGSFGGNTQNL